MPTKYTFTQRWTDAFNRRWLLVVRQAYSETSPTIENVDLEPNTIHLRSIENGFQDLPIGMPNALTAKYVLDIDVLEPYRPDDPQSVKRRELMFAVEKGYVFASNDYHFNVFYLYSDRLNGTLTESEYFVEAITMQRPNVVRKYELSKQKQLIEIDTVCAFKVAIENLSMDGLYTLYFNLYGSTDVTTQGNFNYEYWFGSDRWVRNTTPVGAPYDFELKYIDAKLFLKRLLYLVSAWVILKTKLPSPTDYEDYVFDDTNCNPFTAITFYTQTQNDDATPSNTAVTNPFLLHTLERTGGGGAIIGGFFGEGSDRSPSSESPFRNYKNVYNFLQDLAEHCCTIARPTFTRNTLDEVVFRLDFITLGGGTNKGTYDIMQGEELVFEQGQDAIKGTKVTSIGRNEDDISEYENNLTFSIADNEYNVKEVIFNPQNDVPNDNAIFIGSAYSGGFGRADKRIVYSNKLYYNTTIASTNAYLKVADKYRISVDGSNYVTVTSDNELLPFASKEDVQIKLLRRQAQGSFQGAIAKFITECFKDAGSGFFTFTVLYEDFWNVYSIGDYLSGVGSQIENKEVDIPSGKFIIVGINYMPEEMKVEVKLYILKDIGAS